MTAFKDKYSFEERLKESTRVRAKFPDRLPIIVETSQKGPLSSLISSNSNTLNIDKKKYLVPNDIKVHQFKTILRKKIKVPAETAIFMYVKNTIPCGDDDISKIYEMHKDLDGFMYFTVCTESTFG